MRSLKPKPLLLHALLLAVGLAEHGAAALSLGDLFGRSSSTYNVSSIEYYGPVLVKTAEALQFLTAAPQQANRSAVGAGEISVPFGSSGRVLVRRNGLNSLYVAFQGQELDASEPTWAANMTAAPFLSNFVYTAEAPAPLVATFSQLTGPDGGPAGPLTQAAEQVMAGERILWVTCTGEGAAGGLAVLCGLASALHFPGTSVDVVTFSTPWAFNPQLSWSFDRLITLYYLWPFNTTTAVPVTPNPDPAVLRQLAHGLNALITEESTLKTALTIPNLPPTLPPGATQLPSSDIIQPQGDEDAREQACYASFEGQTYGFTPTCISGSPKIKDLSPWGPAATVPPPGALPPPSSCPPIICRAAPYLDMSCTAFKNDTNNVYFYPPASEMQGVAPVMATATSGPPALGGLPFRRLHDDRTSGDAIVAWNDTAKEAIYLFKYTQERRDWILNAKAYLTDDFAKQLKDQFPGAAATVNAAGDPQVHAGFYEQFQSLLDEGTPEGNLTSALDALSGGQTPLYVSISGFSLGGALSELAAVWASFRWPLAHILVATQGAPKVGNADFLTLLEATAGAVWRFQFNLDQVPAIPPLSGYRTSRQSIWITAQGTDPYQVILSDRPEVDLGDTTWYDHWCEVFYVPILKNATAVAVPAWVYNATAT